jgi:hypothetical protein
VPASIVACVEKPQRDTRRGDDMAETPVKSGRGDDAKLGDGNRSEAGKDGSRTSDDAGDNRAGRGRSAAEELTLLADLGFKVAPAAASRPTIDWSRKAGAAPEPAPVRSSWGSDFVSALGQRPQERGPNPTAGFKAPR